MSETHDEYMVAHKAKLVADMQAHYEDMKRKQALFLASFPAIPDASEAALPYLAVAAEKSMQAFEALRAAKRMAVPGVNRQERRVWLAQRRKEAK